jgi:hypothetical protein
MKRRAALKRITALAVGTGAGLKGIKARATIPKEDGPSKIYGRLRDRVKLKELRKYTPEDYFQALRAYERELRGKNKIDSEVDEMVYRANRALFNRVNRLFSDAMLRYMKGQPLRTRTDSRPIRTTRFDQITETYYKRALSSPTDRQAAVFMQMTTETLRTYKFWFFQRAISEEGYRIDYNDGYFLRGPDGERIKVPPAR